MERKNNKAISPVVATALLLVVAVVAVVAFQTWFNTYQSGISAQVEQQSKTGSPITIERLEIDSSNTTNCIVYIRNSGADSIQVNKVSVNGASNTTAFNITTGIKEVSITGCSLVKGSIYDTVVQTKIGIFQESELAR